VSTSLALTSARKLAFSINVLMMKNAHHHWKSAGT